jgi:uncharacterized phiE125 gp8 family phage protein
MTLRVVTGPTERPAALQRVKDQLHIDHSDDDFLIDSLILTALGRLEAATQRRFLTQTLEWVLPYWPARIRLPVAPVATGGVVSIKYVDLQGVQQTLDPSLYVAAPSGHTLEIRPAFGSVLPLIGLDAVEGVVIRFVAGRAASAISEATRTALTMLVGALYENRDESNPVKLGPTGLPETVESLITEEFWE